MSEEIPTTESEVNAEDETSQELEQNNEQELDNEVNEDVSDDSDGTQDQEQQIALDDIAGALGLETSDLDVNEEGQVVLKTKVDGEEGFVTFKESKRNYQNQSHLDKKGMEVNQMRERLKAQQTEQANAYAEKLNQADSMLQFAWNQLSQEYQNIDWNTLEQEDPATFAAEQIKFQNRQKTLKNQYEAVQQERQNSLAQVNQQYLAEQESKLIEAIPEWSNISEGEKEINSIRQYGMTLGLTQDEANGLIRAADIQAYRKAKLYDELQKSTETVQKLVKKAPKVSKPGQTKSSQKPKSIEEHFYGT